MDEEVTIIDSNTRNEKIKNFFINNKKIFIISISIILILLIGYFSFEELKHKNRIKLANQFNSIIIDFNSGKKDNTVDKLKKNNQQKRCNLFTTSIIFFIR